MQANIGIIKSKFGSIAIRCQKNFDYLSTFRKNLRKPLIKGDILYQYIGCSEVCNAMLVT